MNRVVKSILKGFTILLIIIFASFILLFLSSLPRGGEDSEALYSRTTEVYLKNKIVLHDDEISKITITSYDFLTRDNEDDENIRGVDHCSNIKLAVENKTTSDLRFLAYTKGALIDGNLMPEEDSLGLYLAKDYENKFAAGKTQELVAVYQSKQDKNLIRDFNTVIIPIYVFNGEEEIQQFDLLIDLRELKEGLISSFINRSDQVVENNQQQEANDEISEPLS